MCERSEDPDPYAKRKLFNATAKQWDDWHWQLLNRITKIEQLQKFLTLTDKEQTFGNLPLSITPHYLSLISDRMDDPLRKAVVPSIEETVIADDESIDPLGEEDDMVAPGLVHRYPDRVLFLVTNFCSTNCRYCCRSRVVGHGKCFGEDEHQQAIQYIKTHKEVRDVLLSGGDPLTMNAATLENIIRRIREIDHVEVIRIGTKVPVVLPQRIDNELCDMLKRYRPLWMNIHFMHPQEITSATRMACDQLSCSGIPLGSQTVLLKGINDNVETMTELVHELVKMSIRPYYYYQCDKIPGSSHFRTSVEKGIEIIKGLRGFTSGFAVPNFVIDAPGGGGKIPIDLGYSQLVNGQAILTNYELKKFVY